MKNVTAKTNVVPAIRRNGCGRGFEAQDNLASASVGRHLADRDVLMCCGPSPRLCWLTSRHRGQHRVKRLQSSEVLWITEDAYSDLSDSVIQLRLNWLWWGKCMKCKSCVSMPSFVTFELAAMETGVGYGHFKSQQCNLRIKMLCLPGKMKAAHKETQIAFLVAQKRKDKKSNNKRKYPLGRHEYLLGYTHTKCSAAEERHWPGPKSLSQTQQCPAKRHN